MDHLSFGSDIWKTSLGKIGENSSLKTDSEDSDDGSHNNSFQKEKTCLHRNKKCSYKLDNEKKVRNRVQWIDECEDVPLASENRHASKTEDSRLKPRPILKYRANCFIIVSE